jgi:hypothetical protein
MDKSLRANKVFIDWSQNADYKTTVAVYSLRAKSETPYVSMPVEWEELVKPKRKALSFEPDEALARVKKMGDLFAPLLRGRRTAARLPPSTVRAPRSIPKPSSQSGRRLFVLARTETGSELWLDMRGRFKRWILRRDRGGGRVLVAMPAGDFEIHPAYYRGEVPGEWRGRTSIEDSGSYEIIEGSNQRRHFDLWFNGRVLGGEWILEKASDDETHKSWRLQPATA